MIIYCCNEPCLAPATKTATTKDGAVINLCDSCAEIFEWGQSRPEVEFEDIHDCLWRRNGKLYKELVEELSS